MNMAKSHESGNKKDKSDTPCPRKSYYDRDISSYGVCTTVILPVLVKAALTTTTTTKRINLLNESKGGSEEEQDDSLLYAVVAGIFYAFVMVFLILANLHPSKSLLADLERYESIVEDREHKFNDKLFAKFILTTVNSQQDFASSNNEKSAPKSFTRSSDERAETGTTPDNSCPECRTYHLYHKNLKSSNVYPNHFQL